MKLTIPSNPAAEKAGLSIIANARSTWLSHQWEEDMFHYPNHKLIFQILKELIEQDAPTDLLSLTTILYSKNLTEKINVGEFTDIITTFSAGAESAADYYNKILWDEMIVRKTIIACEESLPLVSAKELDPEGFSHKIEKIVSQKPVETRTLREQMIQFMDDLEKQHSMECYRLGVVGFDRHIELVKKTMLVVGGLPGGGKSVVLKQMALRAAEAGKRVMYFSLEMPSTQLIGRMLTEKCKFLVKPGVKYLRHQYEVLRPEYVNLSKLKLVIRDDVLDINEIIRHCKREKPDLVVVDYIQLVQTRGKYDSRETEVSKIAFALKSKIAMELDCAVATASQLNDDGKLRESRAIGQHADFVVFINENGFRIGKNREGPSEIQIPAELLKEMSFWQDGEQKPVDTKRKRQ